MPNEDLNLDSSLAKRINISVNDKNALIVLSLGFLTAASILFLIYQANRSVELRIEAAEVWSDYQTRNMKATLEEDPNLRTQYFEEQEVVLRHAVDLREKSKSARNATRTSAYAAALFLLGTAAAIVAFFGRPYMIYPGIILGIIALAFVVRSLL